jgi:hypothetical protein
MGARAKFTTPVDADLLATARGLAAKEGRELQALVDEALADLAEKRAGARPRAHVMAAYLASQEHFAAVYQKLAE